MGIRAGDPWGEPFTGTPDVVVEGDDFALSRAVTAHPSGVVRFVPTAGSQLALAIGLSVDTSPADGSRTRERCFALPMDVLRFDEEHIAVNMIVIGAPPNRVRRTTRSFAIDNSVRATTIVVANGQFCDGLDLVPRGHPGDGRAEVHTYSLQARDRANMRRRLHLGTHVPHPDIATRSVKDLDIGFDRAVRIELDGRVVSPRRHVVVSVLPAFYRILV